MAGKANTIAENIKRLREVRGWTQAELGRMCGVSDKHISALERGTISPGKKMIPKLLDAFAVDELTLRFGEREEKAQEDETLSLILGEVRKVYAKVGAKSQSAKLAFAASLMEKLEEAGKD